MNDPAGYIGFSGVLALIAGVFGYGAIHQRVKNLEACVERSAGNNVAIARLEEQVAAMRSDIKEIKTAVVK